MEVPMKYYVNCEDIIRTGFSLIQLVLINMLLNIRTCIEKIITKLKVASFEKADCLELPPAQIVKPWRSLKVGQLDGLHITLHNSHQIIHFPSDRINVIEQHQ